MSSFDTCTLETCSISQSIFQYRPSLGANVAFIVLFGIGAITHTILGIRWKTWSFSSCVVVGCFVEMIGYGGRVRMWQDVFDFSGFIMQIVCITIAPVFFSAAIYLTLYKAICTLQPGLARFKPQWYYVWFIVCDVISLVLQSVGGALSAQSNSGSENGAHIAVAGLAFQVFTLTVFIALSADFSIRYVKAAKEGKVPKVGNTIQFPTFLACWALATICIYIRCCYRVAELSDGYDGSLLKDQGLFIGLEGVPIILAVLLLHIGHPGFGLRHLLPLSIYHKRVSDTGTDTYEGGRGAETLAKI